MTAILESAFPIVKEDMTMEDAFRVWMLDVTRLGIPILGTGSPEGVVSAVQFSLYVDKAGGTGTTQYRKMQPDIAGDVTMGWVLM